MRYIFTAAACTLCAITALLALPPIGESDAVLLSVAAGDRAAVSSASSTDEAAPRQVISPENGAVDTADADDTSLALADGTEAEGTDEEDSAEEDDAELGTGVLGATETADDVTTNDEAGDGASSTDDGEATADESAATTSTSSTTSSTTSTTTTTAAPTTTTAAPTTTTEPPSDTRGVIITATEVVLPIVGPGADGGWRALTPCGNEVTLHDGERVGTVDFVIDPGHGGSETGAVGPAGATEKELNLRISEIVEWYLEEAGYSVLLTRRTDIRIPLRSRAEIANALMPDAFISIHHNGGATRPQSTPGTEMFVDAGNPESRRLGGILFEEVTKRLSAYEADWVGTWRNGVSARLKEDGADLYGIHRYTPDVVSVITEAGYLSNASEEVVFTNNDAQWAHGRAIADALIRWKTTQDAGSGHLDDFVDESSSGTGGFDNCTDPTL